MDPGLVVKNPETKLIILYTSGIYIRSGKQAKKYVALHIATILV